MFPHNEDNGVRSCTCFGEVLLVITEILQKGDTVDGRVVPARRLQQHDLWEGTTHLSERNRNETRKMLSFM